MPVRLVFLGPPGAGKGTQARILEQRFGVKQISSGDILRANLAQGTKLGLQAEAYMRRGELVPDDLVVAMIDRELQRHSGAFVIDGFPRTVGQAEALDRLLEQRGWPLDAAIHFQVDRETLIARLSSRWTNPRNGRTYNTLTNPPRVLGIDDEDGGPLVQRQDDQPETLAKRLEVFDRQTQPVIEYYRKAGKLVEVDALASVEAVADRIDKATGAAASSEIR
jgi:adenylate kinase